MAVAKAASDADKQAAVEKALGEPYMPDFSEEALKVRRNLLAVSLISIAGTIAGVRVAPDSPVFGFHLEHLNQAVIGDAIVVVIGYMLAHFLWYVVDEFAGWRLRVTGTRVTFITTGMWASDDLDYPSDPRQSTLYNWWKSKGPAIKALQQKVPNLDRSLKSLDAVISGLHGEVLGRGQTASIVTALGEVRQSLDDLQRSVEAIRPFETSPRILVSLRRFDRWYSFWLRSQNLRWIVLDAGLPLVLGAGALALLLTHQHLAVCAQASCRTH